MLLLSRRGLFHAEFGALVPHLMKLPKLGDFLRHFLRRLFCTPTFPGVPFVLSTKKGLLRLQEAWLEKGKSQQYTLCPR
jgi:hypothetical protein